MNTYAEQIKWFTHINKIQATYLLLESKLIFNGNPLFCHKQMAYVETPIKVIFYFISL